MRELLTPALITASLTNDLFSFEKERDDANVQNAVLVVMKERGCSEEKARDICKERIRLEVAKYVRVVKDTRTRTDLSDDTKRYIEVMQYTLSGNVAWSTQCPRYNADAKWNELQLLRAKYGVEKYPARWPPEDATDGPSVKTERKEPYLNGDSHANGHKRKRNGNSTGDDIRMNGTNAVKKAAHIPQPSGDSLVLADVVALTLDWNLPELSNDVSWTSSLRRFPANNKHVLGAVIDADYQVVLQPYRYLTSLPSKGFRDQAIDSLNTWLRVPPKSAKMIKNVVEMLHSASLM